MSFGDIIVAWFREQERLGKIPATLAQRCELCQDLCSSTDSLCDAIHSAKDVTPLRLLAAHFGYALQPFEDKVVAHPSGHDSGDTSEGMHQNIHC